MKKIALIIPYFGKLPEYFNVWLKSCSYNETIDFFVFTDDKTQYTYPKNVFVNYCEFSSIQNRIKKMYSFDVKICTPYKLCDYKPAYGEVFSDYIKGYDYWGHCDIDLIFGDIRYFLSKYLDNQVRFLTRGHFSLYKNNIQGNKLYKMSHERVNISYIDVFSSPKSFSFDEWGGLSKILKYSGIEQFDERIFADISPEYGDFRIVKMKNYDKQFFIFSKGKVFRCFRNGKDVLKDEFLYIHMQKRKFTTPKLLHSSSEFYISPTGFYDRKLDFSDNAFETMNKSPALYRTKFRFNNLKLKLSKLLSNK